MRVLWLSHLIPYPPKGGVQQRSYNLIRELAKQHEVVLVAFNQAAHLDSTADLSAALAHMGAFCTIDSALSIPCDLTRRGKQRLALRSVFGQVPYTVRWLSSRDYGNAVRTALKKHAPDAIHFDTISLAQYRSAAPTVPACLNHHNVESDMLLRRSELASGLPTRLYFHHEGVRLQRYERAVANRFNAHLTCSDLDAERLKTIAGSTIRTETIPNGVDLDYFSPTSTGVVKPGSLVFAGRLSWYPNAAAMQFMVREIWPSLTSRCPGTTLKIIGKGASQELRQAAATDSRITVTGFVDDVRPYLQEAQVYVCPIFDGGGTKLKMLDALAMGCAIVAHPVACEGIDVTDGKDVLFASSPLDFVNAISRLFADDALRMSLSANAVKLAREKYSFLEIGRRLANVYESLRNHRARLRT